MPISITYRPTLYLGDSISGEELDKIKKKLEKNPLLSGVFLIAISNNTSDQLNIFDAKQMIQSYYRKHPPYVIGIAGSWEEAVELVERLVQECLNARGDCSLKEYLLC